jgi:type I restriction enzyme S subunit
MSIVHAAISDVCVLVTDGTHYTPPDTSTGKPFLTVKDFTHDGHVDLSSCAHISDEEFRRAEAANCAPQAGDVLFSKDGTVGKVYVVKPADRFAVLSSLAILRPDPRRLDPHYFGWALRTESCLRQATRKKTGSAIRRIILRDLRQVVLPVPSLPEQKRIAAILDAADALRAKRRESIEQLDSLIQATFLEMFGDPVTNPKGWPRASLHELGDVITGNTPSRSRVEFYGDAIEWIKSDNINDPSFTLTKASEGLSELGRNEARIAPKGSILVTCIAGSRNCIGNAAVADREVAFNQQINAFVPGPKVAVWYSFGFFLLGKSLIQASSTNSMKGMVSKSAFQAIRMPLPPIDLQKRFALIFESVNQQKARLKAHLAELDTLFASLQSRAFNGELVA